MQYRGQYPADVMERLKKFKRSQVYYRMTTNKVDMMVARLMDLLFPGAFKELGHPAHAGPGNSRRAC